MQAIQTRYAGCHFRSRLEARWAVFFDALSIDWRYEPEGFEYDGWRYLPDFYLPSLGCYAEVKGDTSKVTDDYLEMLGFVGHFLPGVHSGRDTTRGLVLLGDIPRPDHHWAHCHLTHHKGLQIQSLWWRPGGADVYDRELYFPDRGHSADNVNEYELPLAQDARRLWEPYPWFFGEGATLAAYAAARSARFEHGASGPT